MSPQIGGRKYLPGYSTACRDKSFDLEMQAMMIPESPKKDALLLEAKAWRSEWKLVERAGQLVRSKS